MKNNTLTYGLIALAMATILTACTSVVQRHREAGNQVIFADPIVTTSTPTPTQNATISIDGLPRVNTFILGELTPKDYDALSAVAKHNSQQTPPLLSGISRELPPLPSMTFTGIRDPSTPDDKSLSVATLDVAGAEMLRVRINFSDLPPDIEIFTNSQSRNQLSRWIPNKSLSEWSPIIFGSYVVIAVRSKQKIESIDLLGVLQIFPLTVDGNLMRNKEVFIDGHWTASVSVKNMGPLVDSTCKTDENTRYRNLPNFVRQIESATALLATVTSLPTGAVVSGFCTGTRVASLRDPQGYYILTANHCFAPGNPPQSNATPNSVGSTQVFWDYRTGACNSAGPVQFSSQQLLALQNSGGAALLGARFQSDSVLFSVTPATGTRIALGWQLGLQLTNDAYVHRVSHPNAHSAAYTLQLVDHIENLTYCEPALPRIEYFNSALMQGATSPVSSGSAVVTQNLRVVGQQYGLCKMTINGNIWHIHVDGELSRSWPAFGAYLQ